MLKQLAGKTIVATTNQLGAIRIKIDKKGEPWISLIELCKANGKNLNDLFKLSGEISGGVEYKVLDEEE
jgi:hypothetical protein